MVFRLASRNRLMAKTVECEVHSESRSDSVYVELYCGDSFVGYALKSEVETGNPNMVHVRPAIDFDFTVVLSALNDVIANGIFMHETKSYYIIPNRITHDFNAEYYVITKDGKCKAKSTCDRQAYREGFAFEQYPNIGDEVTVKGKRWKIRSVNETLTTYTCKCGSSVEEISRKTIVKG